MTVAEAVKFEYYACRKCRLTWERSEVALAKQHQDTVHPAKRNCFGEMRYSVKVQAVTVTGTHKDTVTCGGACLTATGPDCECSCGGEHHGRYA